MKRSVNLCTAAVLGFWVAATCAGEAKPSDQDRIRLYVPLPKIPKRVGDDVTPLAKYIKAVADAAGAQLKTVKAPAAKGLLIAVGIKPGKKARVWCEPVEGELPADFLKKLVEQLTKIEAPPVHDLPMAFALDLTIGTRRPKKFPDIPAVWHAAVRKAGKPLVIPDGLFPLIWPD